MDHFTFKIRDKLYYKLRTGVEENSKWENRHKREKTAITVSD